MELDQVLDIWLNDRNNNNEEFIYNPDGYNMFVCRKIFKNRKIFVSIKRYQKIFKYYKPSNLHIDDYLIRTRCEKKGDIIYNTIYGRNTRKFKNWIRSELKLVINSYVNITKEFNNKNLNNLKKLLRDHNNSHKYILNTYGREKYFSNEKYLKYLIILIGEYKIYYYNFNYYIKVIINYKPKIYRNYVLDDYFNKENDLSLLFNNLKISNDNKSL